MKRIIPFFIIVSLISCLMGCEGTQISNANAAKILKTTGISDGKVHLLLYFPDETGRWLIPEDRLTTIDKFIEKTIAEEIIKGPLKSHGIPNILKKVRVISVTGEKDTLILNMSKEFVKSISDEKKYARIVLYSLVNSLTELPGVKKVKFKCEGEVLKVINNIDFSNSFTRDRNVIKRDKSIAPDKVLQKEMTYEKNGEWLNSYLLMSDDENNMNRKYFQAYYEEMQDSKESGFLNVNFMVDGYKLENSGKRARVKVAFYREDDNKKKVPTSVVYFNCVNIEGAWMVDWTHAQ